MGRNKDFDDEDFSFDDDNDELRGGMGDEEGEFGFDDDLGDLGDEGFGEFDMGEPGEDFALEEEPTAAEGGRSSRTFVTLAVAMIALFLIGLAVVLFLATRPKQPSPVELTSTSIAATNAVVAVLATGTAQANAILFVTQTAEALATDTPTPTPTFTPTLTPTPPPALPTLDLTQQAGTQIALQQTLIAGAPTLTFTPPVPSGGISPEDVQATATALAQLLLASPTPEQLTTTPGIGGGATTVPGQLPETGLLDDFVAGGSQGIGALLLIAFGLVGVIIVSRRLRTANK